MPANPFAASLLHGITASALLLTSTALAANSPSPLTPPPSKDLPTTESLVGHLNLPILPESLVISPDNAHISYAIKATNPALTNPEAPIGTIIPLKLFFDDKPINDAYSRVTPATWSPDSKRVGYAVEIAKNNWNIIIDNQTAFSGADLDANPLLFSPDSRHVAFNCLKDSQWHVVLDGKEWPGMESASAVGVLKFSPDSQHLAAVVRLKTDWALYIDGQKVPPPANSKQLLARFVDYAWSPDSSSIAYLGALPNRRWQIFSTAKDQPFESKQYDGILKGTPLFSVDSTHLLFAANTPTHKWTILTSTDENPQPPQPFDSLRPDALAFIESDSGPKLLYIAQTKKAWQLYVDHKPVGQPFDSITDASFVTSPDHKHYAFAGTRFNHGVVFQDGVDVATYDEPGAGTFAFSPDSQHLAYAAKTAGKWHVYLDGVEGKSSFLAVAAVPLSFSPDSSQLAFTAATAQNKWRLILGLHADYQSKPYDTFLRGSKITWTNNHTIQTLAIQLLQAKRIEAKTPLK